MLKRVMPVRRQYHGGCAVAYALDQLGHRWTIPVIKELLFGGMRFSALKSRLPGIGPNVLIQRLSELEELGLVRQRELPEPTPVNVYELTEEGLGVRPLIVALARWSVHSTAYEIFQPLSPASLMILLEARLNADAASGVECGIEFRVGHESFIATLSGARISIDRDETKDTSATVSGSTAAICQYLFGDAPIGLLESDGRVSSSGDRAVIRKLPAIFGSTGSLGPD